jgi:hypothetical protein
MADHAIHIGKKVNLSLCLNKHYEVETCGRVNVQPRFLDLGTG